MPLSAVRGRAGDPAASRRRLRCGVRQAARRESARRTTACRRTPLVTAAFLPFARARQLLDFPHDDLALNAAEMIDEELAVQMIHLVLECACEQPGPFALMLRSVSIQSFDDGARGADDGRLESRQTEASLLFELHPLAHEELRVDHHDECVRIATDRHVDDEDPQWDADLRS